MIKGVTPNEYNEILNILNKYDGEFFAYGSRVKGDFSKSSDLDILIKSNNYENIINNLKSDFDNSHISYIVNFTNANTISEDFYNLIKNDLVKIK